MKIQTDSNGKALVANGKALVANEVIVPTGNINITNTNVADVSEYATARVVDSNLTSGNIKDGIMILGITGSLVVNKYYTGSSEPPASLGNNGDIYLKA